MKLEGNAQGDLFIDPAVLSSKFCLHPLELQRRMRIGLITSLIEAGSGEDEGRRRITVRSVGTAWRAIIDGANNVTSEELIRLR